MEPLNIIFNKSLEEGVFPTEMKKADTVPLYKSKDKDDKKQLQTYITIADSVKTT